MEVAATNNDSGVNAGYFVKAVERSGGTSVYRSIRY